MSVSYQKDSADVHDLSKLFNEGLTLFNKCEKSDEPTNSLEVQVNIKKCIKIFEKTTVLCSFSGIFSKNEGIDEVPTNYLQYFLLPAILGSLHLKLTSGERRNIVDVSEVYFTDFMERCVEYQLCQFEIKTQLDQYDESKKCMDTMEELLSLARRRAIKIGRYKKQQELKRKLGELKSNLENEHVDEDIKRNYFLVMIQLYIHEAIEELNSLHFEKLLLDHMDKLKKNEKPKVRKRPSPLLRPVVITKDVLQETIFDTIYPSLATLTIKEFYNKTVKDKCFGPNVLKDSMQSVHKEVPEQDDEELRIVKEIDTDDYHIIEAMRQIQNSKDFNFSAWKNDVNRN